GLELLLVVVGQAQVLHGVPSFTTGGRSRTSGIDNAPPRSVARPMKHDGGRRRGGVTARGDRPALSFGARRTGLCSARLRMSPPYTLKVENDVTIPTRDGGTVCANVFRPVQAGEFPVIMTMGPYPKDIPFKVWNPIAWKHVPETGEHMHWET